MKKSLLLGCISAAAISLSVVGTSFIKKSNLLKAEANTATISFAGGVNEWTYGFAESIDVVSSSGALINCVTNISALDEETVTLGGENVVSGLTHQESASIDISIFAPGLQTFSWEFSSNADLSFFIHTTTGAIFNYDFDGKLDGASGSVPVSKMGVPGIIDYGIFSVALVKDVEFTIKSLSATYDVDLCLEAIAE